MNFGIRIILFGLLWGLAEASLLYLAFLFPIRSFLDIPTSFYIVLPASPVEEGLLLAGVLSFVSGMLLVDTTNTLKSLLIATFIATLVALLVSITLVAAIPIHLSDRLYQYTPEGQEILFYSVLSPLLFIIGFVFSTTGATLGGWRAEKRERRLHPLRPLDPINT